MMNTTAEMYLKGSDLQEKINKLHYLYQPIDLNYIFHESKMRAIKSMKSIIKESNRRSIQECDYSDLLICSLTLVYYFGMRLKINMLKRRFWIKCDKKLFHRAESAFQDTLNVLQPECSEKTIRITLDFFSNIPLWPYENFVTQILEVILYYSRGRITLFNLMLTDIHCVVFSDVKSARHRMRVLYELLRSDNWIINKQKLLPFITRLLDFFTCSIAKGTEGVVIYRYLKKGFEVCLRRIFERTENRCRLIIITTMLNWFSMAHMDNDEVLEFSSLIEQAAQLYQVGQYSESFQEHVFSDVLANFVGSSNGVYSLVGCRLMVRFLDRHCNAAYLSMPAIYYEFSQTPLKVAEYNGNDKAFLRHYREQIHDYSIKVVQYHSYSQINLRTMFSLIACTILEVPCSLTAAAASCLMMTIQDFALTQEKIPDRSRFWLHAIVLSIMSLICWVHKAPDLYRYVNEIISRRAKDAPQLNPPLLKTYNLQSHHAYWKKSTLFFEDWELRYGLWKHFQAARQKDKINQNKISKKKPIMDINT
ncbi:uncharacterized protein LOC116777858 [Danaus plexippus]|uniref:uncharacterized protein LOC116777858 n=1 Tax=Danaus plexippus TaxID=13037 RepID=UPI0013C49810|nr:uncharacterized protein LOC116777858 [Danaus plexippus]